MTDTNETEQEPRSGLSDLTVKLAADTPKTDLGKQLVETRKKYIANGGKLFTSDEINDEVHKNRGG